MKSFIVKIIALVLITQTIFASEKTDFIVNDDNSLSIQKNPKIAVAADGSFVITWVDRRNDDRDIYLQRFNSDGDPIGRNKIVNDNVEIAYQFEPAIAVDLSGLFSIIWKDYRTSGYPYNPEFFLQRYDSSVTPISTNTNLSSEYPNSIKESPDIALSLTGRGVLVWADYRNDNWDIFGQIISSDGSLTGSNFQINSDSSTSQQHSPKVSISTQGWFVVTWYDNRNDNDDIYVRRFDSLGTPLTADIKVSNDISGSRQAFSDIAADGAGHFTVVWVDWRNGAYPQNPDIYSRKYDTLMNPVTEEININTDGANTAQREPVIASDRMGNVAIIWADSTGSSWDIAGQMIDVDGVVRETNFKANSFTDSLQFSPDVALDGRYRYLTWSDKRNGNFDIYASIQRYNEPSLSVNPKSLKFEMKSNDILPLPQNISLEHFGYNPLPFTVSSSVDWLTVSPSSGITPENITVSVNTNTLTSGVYLASLTFTDTFNNDSSVVISVRLDVYVPTMKLSKDTLFYSVFEGVDEAYSQFLIIENEWLGQFNWNVIESYDWLSLSSYSGTSGETILIDVNPLTLSVGSFVEPLQFNSPDAAGSPDTLFLSVEVINDMPFLGVSPDSVFIFSDNLAGFDTTLTITNQGVGSLNWTAITGHNWLQIDKINILNNDSLVVTIIDSLLNIGTNISWVEITDTNSFNISAKIPFVVNLFNRSTDTIKITSTSVETSQSSSISVLCNLVNTANKITLPLVYDTTFLTVDSILPGVSYQDIISFTSNINQLTGNLLLNWETSPIDTFIDIGESHLAEIFFTARTQIIETTLDTLLSATSYMMLRTSENNNLTPIFIEGTITISNPTAVNPNIANDLPKSFELHQNYPNPFNLSTIIRYQLPQKSEVSLEIFNVLGQKVKTLINRSQTAGIHEINWDGISDNNLIVTTGLYFYRLKTENNSLVKKMMLLK